MCPAVDVPTSSAARCPAPDAFEHRYVLHPVLVYLHIVPGVVCLVLAPLQ